MVTDTFRDVVTNNKYYIIKFNDFKVNRGWASEERYNMRKLLILKYNLNPVKVDSAVGGKTPVAKMSSDTLKAFLDDETFRVYFAISEKELKQYSYVYSPIRRWGFAYGNVTELVRIRPRVGNLKSSWGNDLSLGISVGAKYSFTPDFGVTLLGGLAITKVTLDSISTGGYQRSNKDHAALTPSINLLFTYKNFSLGTAIGFDFVNEGSQEVKSWIYNKRGYFGIAFGVNIFTSSSNNSTPSASDGQKTK